MLTQEEFQQLTRTWNATQRAYPLQKSLPQLFEEQVSRTPQAVALLAEEQTLCYEELNRRANQLAHYLNKKGVEPETCIGLWMDKSVTMVIAMLGILKAGGAYVPLDPGYPEERLRLMIEDAGITLVVTQEHLKNAVRRSGVEIICVDGQPEQIAKERVDNPGKEISGEHLAYVIYTSGSTGRPKGVILDHRGRINNFCDFNERFNVNTRDRLLALAPAGFDMSTYDIFGMLLAGGTIVLPASGAGPDPAQWIKLLHQHQITIWHSVPALLEMLIDYIGDREELYPPALRLALLGGDWLPIHLPRSIRRIKKDLQIINLGGFTEVSMDSTTYEVPYEFVGMRSVPVGRPIANTQLYVLDEDLNPVPVGIAGNLYVGGVGLARGYFNRGDISAERFIPHPFSDEPGSRLYKTGDLARYFPDGNLEFLGRVDFQVKIRGFRIELGEIEAALRLHLSVQECIVTAREDIPGDKRLVAYIILQKGHEPIAPTTIREHLKQVLPAHMVPSVFVFLDTLPLTPNGKVDRQSLPVPQDVQNRLPQDTKGLRTPLEDILLGIWEDILGVTHLSVDDDFFEAGGHSLLATQIIARLRRTLHVEIPLKSLFEAPTIASFAHIVQTTLQQQQDTLIPSLHPTHFQGNAPLSFAQQRLWFLDQMNPNDPAYNISVRLHLSGNLNVSAVRQSLNQVVERHEILRTTFVVREGKPVQQVVPAMSIPIPIVDLRNIDKKEQEKQIELATQNDALMPFDLKHGPLLRATLLQVGSQDYIFLFTMHHIICDGWSYRVLVDELAVLYEHIAFDTSEQLPALPLQYSDYAIWQRKWMQGTLLDQRLAYWQMQLAGAPPLLELPIARSRPAIQTFRGKQHIFRLSPRMLELLQRLSQRSGTTLFMVLLAGFQLLLARYSGQTDILVGTPIANRAYTELEALIGFFVNTVVLRTRISGELTVWELLARVRTTALNAYAYQDLPFEKLVEVLQPERDLSYSPLFQIAFVLQNVPPLTRTISDLTVKQLDDAVVAARADLTLNMWEDQNSLLGAFQYNTDLFEEVDIIRMAQHYCTLLEGMVEEPNRTLANLPMLTQEEFQQLTRTWNATQRAYPLQKSLPQLFEEQVSRTPQAVALLAEEQTLCYEELNRRANQLAHYLNKKGVEPETCIGLWMDKSVTMVIAMLGILKAGGAYVPLDPGYPEERLRLMIEDAGITLVVTQEHLKNAVRRSGVEIICVDGQPEQIAKERVDNPGKEISGEHLAYVIYTSGSTGRPKGVMIEHRALVNRIAAFIDIFSLDASHRQLQLSSISFDISVEEIFPTLCSGACLLLHRTAKDESTIEVLAACQRFGITKLNTTPSYWHQLALDAKLFRQSIPGSLKFLVSGGERPSIERLKDWTSMLQHPSSFFNVWGATEGTIFSTMYEQPLKLEALENRGSLPIGHPIANTQTYILDEYFNPVPVLVPGELYIGGEGIARGYLCQPDLTAEKFIPDPFSKKSGWRLYRTGDRGRYLRDGTIEFLGRMDHQVKIRGFRIELGEIEAVLAQHPIVQKAVVLVKDEISGDRKLIAYIVAKTLQTEIESNIHNFLTERLPDYMIPAQIIPLEALPLTPNGKVNYQALTEIVLLQRDEITKHALPQTWTEQRVLDICIQVLEVPTLGIYDDFFNHGGHSLHVARIAAQVQHELQVELSVLNILETPCVADLARQIDMMRSELQSTRISPLSVLFEEATAEHKCQQKYEHSPILGFSTTGSRYPFFCICPVNGGILPYMNLSHQLGSDQPFYSLQAVGLKNEQDLYSDLNALVSCYIQAIEKIQIAGPYFLGGWSIGGAVAFAIAQQLAMKQEVAMLALLDSSAELYFEQKNPLLEDDTTALISFLQNLRMHFDGEISPTRDAKTPKDTLHAEIRYAHENNILPHEIGLEHIRRRQEMLRIHARTISQYGPQVYSGNVTLIRAHEGAQQFSTDPTLGWGKLVSGSMQIIDVPGDHYSMFASPNIQVLADHLRSCLLKNATKRSLS
nr:non-ribosomal peptide synthetase [Reticulibacter mediterranei]